jgi:hypothetical protein
MKMHSNAVYAMFVALVGLPASFASAAQIPWTVRGVESSGTGILDIANAEQLLDGQIKSATDVTTNNFDVINFNLPDDKVGGLFPNPAAFPGTSIGHEQNFAEQVTGTIQIPKAGYYTFGVNSDDGFSLTVGSNSMSYPGMRSPAQSYSTFDFAKAGAYSVNLVYFQHTINAELELFASPGKYTAYGQSGSNFRLVGDTAHGGLSLVTPSTGSGNVPEPSAAVLLAPFIFGLLRRPRRSTV